MVFHESELQFEFASRYWAGRKYDEHTFFRGLSGAGLKGVDFLGIYRGRRLVLLEVKHFRHSGKAPVPEVLAAEIAAKVQDTLQGIWAIHQYFERNWFYRLAEPALGRLPGRHRLEWPFWTRAFQLAQHPETREAVVWLEVEKEPFPRAADLAAQIRSLLPDPWSVTVASRHDHPFAGSLRVE